MWLTILYLTKLKVSADALGSISSRAGGTEPALKPPTGPKGAGEIEPTQAWSSQANKVQQFLEKLDSKCSQGIKTVKITYASRYNNRGSL